jgi:hypothetical protein
MKYHLNWSENFIDYDVFLVLATLWPQQTEIVTLKCIIFKVLKTKHKSQKEN